MLCWAAASFLDPLYMFNRWSMFQLHARWMGWFVYNLCPPKYGFILCGNWHAWSSCAGEIRPDRQHTTNQFNWAHWQACTHTTQVCPSHNNTLNTNYTARLQKYTKDTIANIITHAFFPRTNHNGHSLRCHIHSVRVIGHDKQNAKWH